MIPILESKGVFRGKNGFYNTWVTRADGLWVLTVNSNRLTTFIDKDRWFRENRCNRVCGKSKRENRNKKSIQRLQWLLYGLGPGGFPRPPRKDMHPTANRGG